MITILINRRMSISRACEIVDWLNNNIGCNDVQNDPKTWTYMVNDYDFIFHINDKFEGQAIEFKLRYG